MNKIITFDYLRSIATILVFFCHFTAGCNIYSLARFLAADGNTIFFLISALLLGYNPHTASHSFYSYIKKRISRINYSYYPYLVCVFLFVYLHEHTLNPKWIISHFLYLTWFIRIPGFGHLWFLTLIICCYITYYFIEKWRKYLFKINKQYILIYFAVCFMISSILEIYKLPGIFGLYLGLSIFFYTHSQTIITFMQNLKFPKLLFTTFLAYIITILLFFIDLYEMNKLLANIFGSVCGILTISCFINKTNNITYIPKWMNFISLYSFEIYLVHNVFVHEKYNLVKYTDNPLIALILSIILSLSLAFTLHKISIILKNNLVPYFFNLKKLFKN